MMVHEFSACIRLEGDKVKQAVLGLGSAGLQGGNSIADFLRQAVKRDWRGHCVQMEVEVEVPCLIIYTG